MTIQQAFNKAYNFWVQNKMCKLYKQDGQWVCEEIKK